MLALLLAASPAMAWTHKGDVWSDADFPLEWYLDDTPEDSLPDYDLQALIQRGWDGWNDATCAALTDTYLGTVDDDQQSNDGRNVFYWDDPADKADVGVLGVTYTSDAGGTINVNGESLGRIIDADIVMNNDVDWATPEDFQNGTCTGNMIDAEGVLTHEIGHLHGMGHSCEEGDVCNETLEREATMYWSVGPCDHSQADINQDDIDGITGLYGPYGSFSAVPGSPRSGGTPLDVAFQITSEQTVLSAHWKFGDGETSEEVNPTHTYAKQGQFTVSVSMDLEDAECGSYTYNSSQLAYVVACDPPKPEDGAGGFFTIAHTDGLTYETINRTDVSVYGCIDTIEWQVYKGSSEADITGEPLERIGAWSPKITFPEAGSYVVVMNVGGPGGLDAGYVVVNAEDVPAEGEGCAVAPIGGSAAGLVLAGLVAGLRRRRGARA